MDPLTRPGLVGSVLARHRADVYRVPKPRIAVFVLHTLYGDPFFDLSVAGVIFDLKIDQLILFNLY